jgi:hypothetical protein
LRIKVINAALLDPAASLGGEEGELHIENGRIVERVESPDLVIEAGGGPVLPGGIELGSLVGSPLMVPATAADRLPPLKETIRSYLRLGYTHVNVRGVPLWAAGASLFWLARLSLFDRSIQPLLNLSDIDLLIKEEDGLAKGMGHAAYILGAGGGIGLSVAEPFVRYKKDYLSFREAGAEGCTAYVAGLAEGLGLNICVDYTPELKGLVNGELAGKIHLGGVSKEDALDIASFLDAGGTADIVAQRPETGLALETGLFEPLKVGGAEPFLHESGAIALAGISESGDPGAIEKLLKDAGPEAVALATRTVPAKVLGLLREKGTLAVGALADVAIFGPEGDLARCRHLIKSGVLVLEDGEPTGNLPESRTYINSPRVEPVAAGDLPGSFRPENLKAAPERFGPVEEV